MACRVKRICLAAAFAAASLWAAAAPTRAGEPAATPRQREILTELATFRPAWAQATGEWMLSEWDSDSGLAGVIEWPAGEENAAARFRELEDLYPAEAAALATADSDGARGVDALLAAAEMGTCRLSPDYYPQFDSVEAKQPDFQIMRLYLQGLLRRAEKAGARGDTATAERCYRAAIICGKHLTDDRSSSLVYVTGLIFKLRGAQGYAGLLVRLGRADAADAVKTYATRLTELMRSFMWKANVALSEFGGFACLPAVVRIATADAAVFWRKEAVVRLATLRYGVPDTAAGTVERDVGFEAMADAALSAVAAADNEATVRRLAVWCAVNVRPEGYGALRHRFGGGGEGRE